MITVHPSSRTRPPSRRASASARSPDTFRAASADWTPPRRHSGPRGPVHLRADTVAHVALDGHEPSARGHVLDRPERRRRSSLALASAAMPSHSARRVASAERHILRRALRPADDEAHRRVTVPPSTIAPQSIETTSPSPQDPPSGNPVDHLVVDGDADRRGVSVVPEEAGGGSRWAPMTAAAASSRSLVVAPATARARLPRRAPARRPRPRAP